MSNYKEFDGLTTEEQRSLLILLMEDLRGDWNDSKHRLYAVEDLAERLGVEDTLDRCRSFYEDGWGDGRHFRVPFAEYGGYEDPPFPVIRKWDEASDTFRRAVMWCHNPQYRLEGVPEDAR